MSKSCRFCGLQEALYVLRSLREKGNQKGRIVPHLFDFFLGKWEYYGNQKAKKP